jgi:deoxyribonuclease V
MILALDVYYKGNKAKAVGLLFEWKDAQPIETKFAYLDDIDDYIPGEFYKRELPALLEVIELIDLDTIEAIIIDGYVYIDNENKPGLGARLWQAINQHVPVIGVAKTSFATNKSTVVEVFRSDSKNPLYVSAVGMAVAVAGDLIKNMPGDFRMPQILKLLDKETRENWEING